MLFKRGVSEGESTGGGVARSPPVLTSVIRNTQHTLSHATLLLHRVDRAANRIPVYIYFYTYIRIWHKGVQECSRIYTKRRESAVAPRTCARRRILDSEKRICSNQIYPLHVRASPLTALGARFLIFVYISSLTQRGQRR